MEKHIELNTENDTTDLAAYIAPLLKPGDVLCLYGELGTGKTFFTKQLGKLLFIHDEISSPSFVLMNEYKCGKYPLYHLDLYRLKEQEELLDLGLLDMIESGITVIEWPELTENFLPYQTFKLYFHFDGKKRWVNVMPDAEHEQYFSA
jgi:tRNA threonylcarbamoyladenosine biosynthesis protein TsaE